MRDWWRVASDAAAACHMLPAPVPSVGWGNSLWEQEGDVEAQAPVGTAARPGGVILRAQAELNRLFADLEQLANASVERNAPLMIFPIVSCLGVDAEGGELFRRVSQERLEEGGVHVVVAPAGVRPDVVDKYAIGPAAVLLEQHRSRSHTPFAGAKCAVGRRGPGEY